MAAIQTHSRSKAIINKHQKPENKHSSVVNLNTGERKAKGLFTGQVTLSYGEK